jgi:hypothetical protein
MLGEAPAGQATATGGFPPRRLAGKRASVLRLARYALVVVASVSVVLLTILALDLGGRFRLGSIAVTINDYRKPLLWGVAAAAWLLSQEWRRPRWWLIAFSLIAALGVLAAVNFTRTLPPIITDADLAIAELYTELASRGRLLLGPYSRFGWHHPGPLYFYLQAPLYALGGHQAASLYAGAVAINIVALLTIAWVTARENRGWLLVLVTGACVLLAWRVPRLMASPWTAHVPILPSLAFGVLCAAVASGRRGLLPLTVVFGSFIAQTHAALVPMVGLIGAALLVVMALDKHKDGYLVTSALNRAAWIGLAVWLLPISEALSHAGGNVAALWRFFVLTPAEGQPLREAFVHWSYGLTGVLRPDLALPWGGHFALAYLWWGIPCAIAQVVVLAAIARRDLTAGRRFEGYLAGAMLLASSIGLWALTRIRGDILDHEIFWLSALGSLNLAVIGAAWLRGRVMFRVDWWAGAIAVPACVALLVLGLAIGVNHLRDFTAFELRRTERSVILAAHASIRDYLRRENVERPLLRVDNEAWSESAGVLLRLYRDGTAFAVTDASLPMFTNAFSTTGREDAVVTIGPESVHRQLAGQPSNVVLLEAHPVYVDAMRIAPVPVR